MGLDDGKAVQMASEWALPKIRGWKAAIESLSFQALKAGIAVTKPAITHFRLRSSGKTLNTHFGTQGWRSGRYQEKARAALKQTQRLEGI
jgi:hypothetical protein